MVVVAQSFPNQFCKLQCRPLNSDRTELAPIVRELAHKSGSLSDTQDGTRTHNLLLMREAPYPLGHKGCVFQSILIQSSFTSPYGGYLAVIAHGSPPVVRVPLPPPFVSFCSRPAPFCSRCAPSPFCSRVPLPPLLFASVCEVGVRVGAGG